MQETHTQNRDDLAGLVQRLSDHHRPGETLDIKRLEREGPEFLAALARELVSFSNCTETDRDEARADSSTQVGTDTPRPTVRLPIIPGYDIERLLGRGGMGIVFQARHRALGRTVAIKMLLPQEFIDARTLRRFQTEAEAVAKLQHPNIVQIFEVGETDGHPWFALEYVAGGSLDKFFQNQPQTPTESAALILSLARAMQACHDRGIIHRDLKPANVLLAAGPTSGQRESTLSAFLPKIADFGLARGEESHITHSGAILGTPSYMAPEQADARASEVGPASDQYALGATLYQLLTGRPPFLGASTMETLSLVINAEPTPPSRLVPTVPADLETICLKTLQKDPTKRYACCSDLADDLSRFLAHQPILARPLGPLGRLARWRKRNPPAANLAGAIAATLVLGTIVSTFFGMQANRRAQTITAINIDLEKTGIKAQKAADEARKQAALADDRAKLALKTLQTVVFEIQTKLTGVPAAQKVRGTLLKTALDGLQQLASDLDRKEEVDRASAIAMLNMASVFAQVGNEEGFKGPASAQRLYDAVVPRLEALLEADPVSKQAMLDLGLACHASAINLERMDESGQESTPENAAAQARRPRIRQAKTLHARNIELQRYLSVQGGPDDTLHLAEALRDAAMLETRAGDADHAKALFDESIQVFQRLVGEHAAEWTYRRALAKATDMLGDWYYDLGHDLDQAETCYRASVSEFGPLATKFPDDPEVQLDLANAWSRLADVYGRRAAAHFKNGDTTAGQAEKEKELEASLKEVAITDALVTAAPENVQYQHDATISYDHLARGYLSIDRYAEAFPVLRKAFDMSMALLEADPENRRHHSQLIRRTSRLGLTYAKLDQPAEALKVLRAGLLKLEGFREKTGETAFDREIDQIRAQAKRLEE